MKIFIVAIVFILTAVKTLGNDLVCTQSRRHYIIRVQMTGLSAQTDFLREGSAPPNSGYNPLKQNVYPSKNVPKPPNFWQTK